MQSVQVSINTMEKVKAFVNDITKFEYDFDLISGRYVGDADMGACPSNGSVFCGTSCISPQMEDRPLLIS